MRENFIYSINIFPAYSVALSPSLSSHTHAAVRESESEKFSLPAFWSRKIIKLLSI